MGPPDRPLLSNQALGSFGDSRAQLLVSGEPGPIVEFPTNTGHDRCKQTPRSRGEKNLDANPSPPHTHSPSPSPGIQRHLYAASRCASSRVARARSNEEARYWRPRVLAYSCNLSLHTSVAWPPSTAAQPGSQARQAIKHTLLSLHSRRSGLGGTWAEERPAPSAPFPFPVRP